MDALSHARTLASLALLATLAALAACATAPPPPAPPPPVVPSADEAPSAPEPTQPAPARSLSDCDVRPIAGAGQTIGALRFEGGFQLLGRSSLFGGLSGLEAIDADSLIAVTDDGSLVRIELSSNAAGAQSVWCGIVDLRDESGSALFGKSSGDAEGLTLLSPGRIAVSFERDHRIATFRLDDRVVQDAPAIDFSGTKGLTSNEGVEALAMLPSGRLLAGGENPTVLGRPQPVWRLSSADGPTVPPDRSFAIDAGFGFALVGLDATPAGGVVVLQRFYDDAIGNRTRIGWLAPGVAETATRTVRMRELARLNGDGLAVDNFEGVAAIDGADGRTTIWIVSDDNFSQAQKTLLYRFSVDERGLLDDAGS